MIVKVTIEYEDGTQAVFTGSPVDLSKLPKESPKD